MNQQPEPSPLGDVMARGYELWATRAEELLGEPGRMVAVSKTRYGEANPRNIAVFNANVLVSTMKVWYGDLDLTLDEQLLRELAADVGEVVSVLSERDARFQTEASPRLDAALFSVAPSGHTRFLFQCIERSRDGKLRRRPAEPTESHLSTTA